MIRAVLFDFDGTLANTLPFYIKAYDKAIKSIGFKFDEKTIVEKCFGKKEKTVCDSLGVPEKTKEFTDSYFLAVKELFRQAPLFAETLPLLDWLKKQGIKIIIITFAYRWYIDQMLKQYNLDDSFDFTISTDDIVHPKPHPEAVFTASKKLGVPPKNTIVVGDSKSDILMGNEAGSKTVLYTRKEYDLFYSLEELKKTNPTYIIDYLSKLKDIVLKS